MITVRTNPELPKSNTVWAKNVANRKPFIETAHNLPKEVKLNPIDRLSPSKFKAPKKVVPVNSADSIRKPIKDIISVASKPSAKVARLNRGSGTFVKFLKKLKIK